MIFLLPILLTAEVLCQTIQLDFEIKAFGNDVFLPQRRSMSTLRRTHALQVPIYNDFPNQRYVVNITAGTPPQNFSVLIDSASTDLWLASPTSPGCAPTCPSGAFNINASSTALGIQIPYNVSFGLTPDNVMLGAYYNDTISIGGAILANQSFAVAEVTASNMIHWGGIMGLGTIFRSSAYENPKSPVYRDPSRTPLPVWLNLHRQGLIAKKLFSVWMNSQAASTGSLLLGGIDDTKYVGELKSTPVLLQGPEQEFVEWTVEVASVARVVGDSSDGEQISKRENLTAPEWSLPAIVDTGSPNMYIPSSLFASIAAPLNVIMHPTANTPYVPCSLRESSAYLEWAFAGRHEEIGPLIRMPYREAIYRFGMPGSLGEVRNEDGEELCYLGIIPWDGGIVLVGDVLLRNAYVVFDGEVRVLRMAQAKVDSGDTY